MVPAVQELRPELNRARRDPSQVTHAPAHSLAGLYDNNAPLRPRPQRLLQRPRRPQPRQPCPDDHRRRLSRRPHAHSPPHTPPPPATRCPPPPGAAPGRRKNGPSRR